MSFMHFGKDRQKLREERERQEKELEERKKEREKRMAERARVLEEQERDLEQRRKEREARMARMSTPSPPSVRRQDAFNDASAKTTTTKTGGTPELLSVAFDDSNNQTLKLSTSPTKSPSALEGMAAIEAERQRNQREREKEREKKVEEENDRWRREREEREKAREQLHKAIPLVAVQPSTPISTPRATGGGGGSASAQNSPLSTGFMSTSAPATAPVPRGKLKGQLSEQNLRSRAKLKFSDSSDNDASDEALLLISTDDEDDSSDVDENGLPIRNFDPAMPLPKLRGDTGLSLKQKMALAQMGDKSGLQKLTPITEGISTDSSSAKQRPLATAATATTGNAPLTPPPISPRKLAAANRDTKGGTPPGTPRKDDDSGGANKVEERRKKKARSLRYQHMIMNLERIRKDKEDELLKKRQKRNSRELRNTDPINRHSNHSDTDSPIPSQSPSPVVTPLHPQNSVGADPAQPNSGTTSAPQSPKSDRKDAFSLVDSSTKIDTTNAAPDTPMRAHVKAMKGDVLEELKRTRIKKLGTLAAAIDMTDLKKERKLGEGSFGVVYLGYCFEGPVAIKVPKLDINELDDQEMEYLLNEINVMATNNHPHIVSCLGACTDRANFAIVLELLDGDLDDLFYGKNPIGRDMSLYQRMNFAKDAAIGMNWLHSIKPAIIHRDLKLENLMYKKIEGHYTVKICDFGLSVIKPEKKKLIGRGEGNVLTMAPEIMLGQEYNTKADVYSFSMILWQLYTGESLFPGLVEFEDFVDAVCIKGERPQIPEDCLPELADLMSDCWQRDQEKRPTFKEINMRLDDILINAAIGDPEAASWWRSSYGLKRHDHSVEWEEFIDFFCEKLDLPAPHDAKKDDNVAKSYWRNIMCLKEILCTKNKGRGSSYSVHLERFGQVVNCFGPLKNPHTGKTILDTIRSVMKKKWFHGDISGHDAIKKIANAPIGTFLIRFSHGMNGTFTSSIRMEEGVVHARIYRNKQGQFYFSDETSATFPLLNELVKKRLSFAVPTPDWVFSSCFRFDPALLDLIVDPDSSYRQSHAGGGSDFRQRGYINKGKLVDEENVNLQKKKAELRAEIDKLRKERASGRQPTEKGNTQ